jgi:hypothetical protein
MPSPFTFVLGVTSMTIHELQTGDRSRANWLRCEAAQARGLTGVKARVRLTLSCTGCQCLFAAEFALGCVALRPRPSSLSSKKARDKILDAHAAGAR